MSDGPFGRRSEPVEPGEPGEPADGPSSPGPGPRPGPPAPPRGISSVTWILGVLVVLALAYITLNSLRTEGPGSEGVARGEPIPAFAAPLVSGSLDGDAQVDPEKACSVRGADVLNSCALREAGSPVVIGFVVTRSKQCAKQVDVLDRVARRHPDVQFAAVGIRGEKAQLAKLAARWKLPVAHDRDGAVSNLFAVAICPTITFARAGGAVEHTSLGLIEEAEVERRVEALTR
jgi:hypothetical protein